MEKFFISDLHFDHYNVIDFDNRPYNSLNEMNEDLINKWNSKVNYNDEVYIVGDFIWKNKNYYDIIKSLKGKKHLILGNHDKRIPNERKYFESVDSYKELKLNGNTIILNHYFIPFYNHNIEDGSFHLYGHSHNSLEFQKEETIKNMFKIKNAYNVGACHLGYEPCTLDEIIKIYKERRNFNEEKLYY